MRVDLSLFLAAVQHPKIFLRESLLDHSGVLPFLERDLVEVYIPRRLEMNTPSYLHILCKREGRTKELGGGM